MKALKETILLGIFFLLLVTTYSSFSFIVTYIYQHKDGYKEMGPLLLGVNYFVFLIANSFVPAIRMNLTTQMKVAAICYTTNYVAQAFQLPEGWGIALSVLGAMAGGYGAALLWVCYGAYMKLLCKINDEQKIQGKYFSILNGITFASILFGSLITTFCLQMFSDQIYFVILSAMGIVSFLFCWFFIKEIEHRREILYAHNWVAELGRSLRYYRKMTAIIPTLIFDGLILGFISASATKLMPKQSQKVQIGIFLVILGVGCIIGGVVSGCLSDMISMKNAGRSAIMLVLLTSFSTAVAYPYLNKPLAYVLAFAWGVCREFLEGWLYVACSRNYNGRLQSYANMKQLHSLSFCIYQIFIIYAKLDINVEYVMLAYILVTPFCFWQINKLPEPIEHYHESNQAANPEQKQNADDVTISLESSSEEDQ